MTWRSRPASLPLRLPFALLPAPRSFLSSLVSLRLRCPVPDLQVTWHWYLADLTGRSQIRTESANLDFESLMHAEHQICRKYHSHWGILILVQYRDSLDEIVSWGSLWWQMSVVDCLMACQTKPQKEHLAHFLSLASKGNVRVDSCLFSLFSGFFFSFNFDYSYV